MKTNENEYLNSLPVFLPMKCNRCKKQYPEIVLDIELYMYNGGKILRCVDGKTCKKPKKKKQ